MVGVVGVVGVVGAEGLCFFLRVEGLPESS